MKNPIVRSIVACVLVSCVDHFGADLQKLQSWEGMLHRHDLLFIRCKCKTWCDRYFHTIRIHQSNHIVSRLNCILPRVPHLNRDLAHQACIRYGPDRERGQRKVIREHVRERGRGDQVVLDQPGGDRGHGDPYAIDTGRRGNIRFELYPRLGGHVHGLKHLHRPGLSIL